MEKRRRQIEAAARAQAAADEANRRLQQFQQQHGVGPAAHVGASNVDDGELAQAAHRVWQRADEALTDWYLDAHQTCVFGSLELKADCLETLKALRAQGLYVSIVSNIDEDMLTTLVAREALGPLLDHWTSSEEAQSCKPHRGFFEYCLRKSGLPAAEILFVGDSPEHDIEGAAAMGMQTALILDVGMPPPLQAGRASVAPQHTISHLRELTSIVGR